MNRLALCIFLLFSSFANADSSLQLGGGYSWYKIPAHGYNLKIENLFNYNFEINLINPINKKNHEINFGLSYLTENYKESDLGYSSDSMAISHSMIHSNFIGPQFSYLIPFNKSKFKIYGGANISYLFLTHHSITSYNYGNGVFEDINFPVENANNLTIGGCLNFRYRCFYSTILFDCIVNSEDMIPIYSYIRDYSFGFHIKIGFILDFHKFFSKYDNDPMRE